uniref:Putative ovule protein n=1 Tax=Solanum chacoense TaxID=4108 RepID=A0A0V0HWV6_SOLCH
MCNDIKTKINLSREEATYVLQFRFYGPMQLIMYCSIYSYVQSPFGNVHTANTTKGVRISTSN